VSMNFQRVLIMAGVALAVVVGYDYYKAKKS
jgi:hypothetical protein